MKQVININFQGRVVPIEVTAFELLKQYTESLSRHFAAEEGRDEIINDIENRIGELFQEKLKNGATCITEDDVNAIIKSMGRPEEFDGEQTSYSSEVPPQEEPRPGVFIKGKKLYRDENEKVIGGVCSGLAHYFGVDVAIVRIIFVILFFAGGSGFLAYLIFWIALPSSAITQVGSVRKRLFRDMDDKLLAGVCSGLGNYFGINPWIPRALFLLPFLTIWNDWGNFMQLGFSPGSLFIYIILWLVMPEAKTTAEKLEMKGEKVDLNSIKNSVMEEMKGMQQRAGKFSKEASGFATEKGKAFGEEVGSAARRGGKSLGSIIALLVKIFVYFILGCIVFGLVAALFGFGIFAIGMFPLKSYVLNDGWQNVFAWGTLIFFIAVPIIGIITWLIRKIARIKTGSTLMTASFVSMWIVGWICITCLFASISKEFKNGNTIIEETIQLSNPGVQKLEISSMSDSKYYRNRWFTMEPFEDLDEDTAFVKNIQVNIVRSTSDSFHVTMVKAVNGRTRSTANHLASLINFNVKQQDSLLLIDKGIAINKKDKFRNQRIILTVYVPVGKQIRIDKSVGYPHNIQFGGPWNENWEIDIDADVEGGWERDVDYIMTDKGLFTLDGKPADEWKHRQREESHSITIDRNGITTTTGDGYRYDDAAPSSIDSLKRKLEEEQRRIKDSLEKEKDKIERQLDRIGQPSAMLNVLPVYNPLALM